MYTQSFPKIASHAVSLYRIGIASIAIGSVSVTSAGVQSEASAPSAASDANVALKTHTLFMGADFDVFQHKKFWRVEGVQGNAFIINENNEKIFVPTDDGALGMKVYSELKLAANSATIANYKAERGYTHGADPGTKFVRENPGVALDAGNDVNTVNLAVANFDVKHPGAFEPDSLKVANAKAARDDQIAVTKSSMALNSFNQTTAAYVNRMESDLEKELFDAMEVHFTVSSPKRLIDPYVVLVAQYREKNEKAGTAHSWIYAQQLHPIDEHPRAEYILQGGLPPGFELISCELHLYNRGQEVGTTVSPKRVELTRDEAFEYLLIDYLASHKGATLMAAPFMGDLPADLAARLTSDQLRSAYFVKISDDGVPLGVYADEACQHKLNDPYIESVIGNLRFKPALDKGKAIPGVARIKLDHLNLQA